MSSPTTVPNTVVVCTLEEAPQKVSLSFPFNSLQQPGRLVLLPLSYRWKTNPGYVVYCIHSDISIRAGMWSPSGALNFRVLQSDRWFAPNPSASNPTLCNYQTAMIYFPLSSKLIQKKRPNKALLISFLGRPLLPQRYWYLTTQRLKLVVKCYFPLLSMGIMTMHCFLKRLLHSQLLILNLSLMLVPLACYRCWINSLGPSLHMSFVQEQ